MEQRFDLLAKEAAAAWAGPQADPAMVRRNLDIAAAMHLPSLTVPRERGGWGANLLEFASYQQLLARGDGATALVLAMHHMLLGGETESGGWPQRPWDELCQAVVAVGALVNSAATEPGAGTPSQAGLPSTAAVAGEAGPAGSELGSWRIRGRKAYTTGAPYLSFMRVSARVEPEEQPAYAARFLVRLPDPGVRLEDAWQPAALAGAANQDVILEGARGEFLYREAGRGCEGTVWFQVAIGATYLGIGYRAYEAIVEFSRARVTATGPVTDRESVRVRLGRARAALEVARRNLLATCREWVETPADREALLPDVALAKITAVNAAVTAADEALRIAGAGGFGAGHPFAGLLLETRAGLSHPPVDDAAHLRLAQRDLD